MIRKFLTRWLIASVSVLAAGAGLLWACAGGDWDEYGVSAFTPESFVDSAYRPFFYSDQFYYGIGHDNAHTSRFNDQVVSEWQAWLGLGQPDTALAYFLLRADKTTVDAALTYLRRPQPSDPMSAYALLREGQKNKKILALFSFLSGAKANEAYAAVTMNYWDYDPEAAKKPLEAAQRQLAADMAAKVATLKDDFLRQRYWFQALRSYFFDGQYDACIAFYDKYKTGFPNNTLSMRAMSYVAGCWYKKKQYAQANYLFSKVYDAGPEFKTVAHFSFHPQEEADWQKTLALCRNKQEQATLWQLLGIYYDEARAIKEIYALDPGSDKLDLLLSRLVNIEENRVSGYTDFWGGGSLRPKRDSASSSTLALVNDIAKAGNTAHPYIWQQAAGYLCFLYEAHDQASAWFRKAAGAMPAQPLARAQLRLLTMVNHIAAAKKIDAATEQLLLPDLQWLETLYKGTESLPGFRFDAAYRWARMTLSARYEKQQETLKAECFNHRDTFYTDSLQVLQMKQFLSKNNASAYEQYCRSIYPISAEDIDEYQAICLTYQDRLQEAISLMRNGSGSSLELLGNPFNGRIRDCHDCDHQATQKVKYTKISLLLKMQEMESYVAEAKDVYANSLLLANAFYNMTYYGNARYFYECEVIGGGQSSPMYISNSFSRMLTDCRLASAYYRKALGAAENEEQKARCTFMLAKCTQNERFNKEVAAGNMERYGYSYFGPVDFKAFTAYKQTKYYQEVIRECGYFRTYLGMK